MGTREIWEKGFDLTEADFRYAPLATKQEYNAAAQWAPPTDIGDAQAATAALAAWAENARKISAIRQQMRIQLLDWLKAGKLAAYGFHVPRQPSDIPIAIPSDLLEDRFTDWKNSAIKGHGLEFVGVRVVHPTIVKEIEARAAPQNLPPAKRRPGRPPIQGYISEAIRSLLEEGKLRLDGPQKANYQPICGKLHEKFPTEFPEGKNPNWETIRGVLSAEVKLIKSPENSAKKQ